MDRYHLRDDVFLRSAATLGQLEKAPCFHRGCNLGPGDVVEYPYRRKVRGGFASQRDAAPNVAGTGGLACFTASLGSPLGRAISRMQ